MHIAIDARIISSTTGRYVERLLHHLEKIDTTNQYTILVKQKDSDYWKPSNPNFSIKIADFKNYTFEEQIGFLKLLNSLNADLVHFCTPEQPVLYRGVKVTTIHDLTLLKTYNPDKNWFIYHFKQLVGQGVFRHVVRSSKYVITPTDYVKDDIVKTLGGSASKITRTYESAEFVSDKSTPYPLPSKRFILFVGQQSDYKNPLRLAEAHQKIIKKYPDLHLVFVGKIDSAGRRTQDVIKKRGYKNIVATGFVSDSELNWLYQNCKAYIFPSLSEGFGLPGLEAMIQGAPVVSSSATCLPEVYGDAAHYFDPLDVSDIAHKIDEVLSDSQLRKQLILNGQKQVKKYSWKKTAEQTLEVYQRALKK